MQVCAIPLKIFQMCSTPPQNISDVQHTTSKYFRCAAHHLEIFQMCSTPPQNISDVQHTTSKYFRCAAHHLEIFQMCSTPPRNISDVQHTTSKYFRCAAHTSKYFKCAAHHLEKFQVRSTPPRNITRSDKTARTAGPRPCGFSGAGFESTRAFSLYRYKGPRALNLPGSVFLLRHLSQVYEFSTGWPSNRQRPCHQH